MILIKIITTLINNNRRRRRMKNNALIVSIFNMVHFHFLAAVFCDLLYYFFIIINVLFFCTRDSVADRDPAKMVPWIVRDVVGASNQSLLRAAHSYKYTFTSDRITFYLHLNSSIPIYLAPGAWSNWTN